MRQTECNKIAEQHSALNEQRNEYVEDAAARADEEMMNDKARLDSTNLMQSQEDAMRRNKDHMNK